MESNLIGVDLGGTYIKTALITQKGTILHKAEVPSEKENGPEGVLQNIYHSIRLVIKEKNVSLDNILTIGVGSPGPLNTKKGIVCNAVNLPGWINIPLRDRINAEFNIPVNLENDANAAAFGEYWKGAGKGSDIMLAYTLGTGVGGGVIIRGELIRGTNDSAGELGHMTIIPEGQICSCGNRGCLEAYASATALVRNTLAKLKKGAPSLLNDWILQGKTLTAKLIDQAHREGDKLATLALTQVGTFLGLGVANVVSVLNPDVVVIGGGMIRAGEVILDPLRREVESRVFAEQFEHLKIVEAQLGNNAGVIGAAGLALESIKKIE